MTDVFISYSRKDIAFARLLHEALIENDLDTWIDWQNIPPSADWLAEVYEAIEAADAFVFVISDTSLISEICGLEINHANKHNKGLIPIVIKDVEAEKVPKELSVLNWIFFDDAGEKFAEAMDDLVTAITVDQDWLKGHTRFQNRALDWERKEKDRGLLLRGADLSDAETWLAGSAEKDPQPTALQHQFILTSREDATRRQRMTLLGVGAALVVAIGLGILAWTQRNVAVAEGNARATQQAIAEAASTLAVEQKNEAERQAMMARAGLLSVEALSHREDDFSLSLLLSVEAVRYAETIQSRSSLLTTISHQLSVSYIRLC
ncbi:MAG: toll/interleukin-1 receptor domain-containing protein [Deltaproteobacteria bacterium]|nr:toll/interleukin-1 receptor domain-containing protein [Deltaproteobacteria bacterium]